MALVLVSSYACYLQGRINHVANVSIEMGLLVKFKF